MGTRRTAAMAVAGLLGLVIAGSGEQALAMQPIGPAKSGDGALFGVSMTSAKSGWAVGKNPSSRGPIVKRWNGESWHSTAVPHPADGTMTLYAVDSRAAEDVWAVGELRLDAGGGEAEILHWDGTGWLRSPADVGHVALVSVDARTRTDVWAVGFDYDRGASAMLHWDGINWARVPLSASLRTATIELNDLVAIASDDAWVVGSESGRIGPAVIGHWNGTSWRRVATPHGVGRKVDLSLFGVTATGSDDVWASGIASDPDGIDGTDGLIEHWDGRRWTLVPSAQPNAANRLDAVTALAPRNAWAVGSTSKAGHDVALTEHWDGSQWNVVTTPPSDEDTELIDVSASSQRAVWAVGLAADFQGYRQVILMWDGHAWAPQQS